MHPVTLATPLFLYAIWLLDSNRLWPFAVCALLILATGELMGLTIAGLGVWYWLARGHRRAGLVIAAAGFAWTLIALEVIVPFFHDAESPFYERFASVGGSPEGVLRTLVTDPGTIASAVLTQGDLVYVVALALPLAGSFVLAPGLAVVALPQLAINTLSDWPAANDSRQHYVAAVIPFLVAASALGLSRVPTPKRIQAVTVVLAFSIGSAALAGPWQGLPGARALELHGEISAGRADALRSALSLVPGDAGVSATNKVGSHLSTRRYFYSLPLVERAEWIVLDTRDSWIERRTRERVYLASAHEFAEGLRSSRQWRQVFGREGVFVFRRVPPP